MPHSNYKPKKELVAPRLISMRPRRDRSMRSWIKLDMPEAAGDMPICQTWRPASATLIRSRCAGLRSSTVLGVAGDKEKPMLASSLRAISAGKCRMHVSRSSAAVISARTGKEVRLRSREAFAQLRPAGGRRCHLPACTTWRQCSKKCCSLATITLPPISDRQAGSSLAW